jgi:hypothetical protein
METVQTNEPPATDEVPGRHTKGRRVKRILLGAVAVVLLLIGLVAVTGLRARGPLTQGQEALDRGRKALLAGNIDLATSSFRQAEADFDEAAGIAGGGLGGLAERLPVVGRNLEVAEGAALAGVELARAGQRLTGAVDGLADGLGSLVPDGGRFPLESFSTLGDDVAIANEHAIAAAEMIEGTPATLLWGPVADARADAIAGIERASVTLGAGEDLLAGFPTFAGADGPRRYLLFAQSPAELRGTGGIWGAYAILTVDDGRFDIGPFTRTRSLPEFPADEVPEPSPDFGENYDELGGAGSWRDLNSTPDFPTAAKAALNLYELGTGERLDGVISADPYALKELLATTGPVEIPGLGVTIGADEVVDFTANEAYIRFAGDAAGRKEILGQVAGEALGRFLAMQGRNLPRLKAIASAVAEGHLRVYSEDPVFQEGLRTARVDGALGVEQGTDLVSVVVNSRSGSKVDFYSTREIDYTVRLGGDGASFATTEVRIRNDAPGDEDLPDNVIEPRFRGENGDQQSIVTISCPARCELVEATRNGADRAVATGSEGGYPYHADFFTIPAGETGTFTTVTARQDAWTGNSSGGSYRMRYLAQPTVKPTELRVEIVAPSGTRITSADPQMEVDGDRAVWEGTPDGSMDFEVRFSAPWPLRWWRNLTRLP